MGSIIDFPQHARASHVSRAANSVSRSEETPASLAFSVERSDDQYSAGMLLRCHHLETCVGDTPGSSDASAILEPGASFGPQSSITERKDVKSTMRQFIGHSVLRRKVFLSLDYSGFLGQNVRMPPIDEKDQYRLGFIDRVRRARASTGKKQWEIALAMGLEQDEYKHFEQPDTKSKKGRVIPHYLIPRFCFACQVDPLWLLSGHGRMKGSPMPELVEQEPEAPVRRSTKQAKKSKSAA